MSEALKEIADRQAAKVNVNGASQTGDATAAAKAKVLVDAAVRQSLGIMIRGLMVSAPGIPPHELLNSICRETGNLCAGAVAGDLSSVLTIRAGFKKAFEDGIKKVPIIQAPGQPAPR